MSETGLKRQSFSKRDLPERDRPEFCNMVGRSLLSIEVDPRPGSALDAAMTFLQLPALDVVAANLSPMRWRYLPHLADNDDLLLLAMRHGAAVVEQRGREVVISGGAATLTANGERRSVRIERPTRMVGFRLSRKLLAPLLADGGAALVRPIPKESQALRLLTRYADILNDDFALADPALGQAVSAHVHDLVALALGATRDAAEAARNGGLRAARRAEILRKMESKLGDPGLTATALAVELGISERYVHLLLEETGQTFAEHVLIKRLDRVAQQLRDPRHSHRKISDIAFAAGFVDLSNFNRSFRRRFGATPSDLRQAARLGGD
jgi:AraC-like DNA-binding protein